MESTELNPESTTAGVALQAEPNPPEFIEDTPPDLVIKNEVMTDATKTALKAEPSSKTEPDHERPFTPSQEGFVSFTSSEEEEANGPVYHEEEDIRAAMGFGSFGGPDRSFKKRGRGGYNSGRGAFRGGAGTGANAMPTGQKRPPPSPSNSDKAQEESRKLAQPMGRGEGGSGFGERGGRGDMRGRGGRENRGGGRGGRNGEGESSGEGGYPWYRESFVENPWAQLEAKMGIQKEWIK